MARAALVPTVLAPQALTADPAGTASVAGVGNGFQVAAANVVGSTPLWFRVTNGTGGAGNFTLKAGTNPLAIAGGQGDLVLSVGATTTAWVGPFETGRFEQSDGTIIIETSVVMTVSAMGADFRRVG